MGFRYRKSINLGGGFRINISKSGVGYSWGVPGYRRTKTATGRVRKTYSIPGTGLSYVDESGKSKPRNNKPASNSIPSLVSENVEDIQTIENADISNFKSAEYSDLLSSIERILKLNNFSTALCITLILSPLSPFFVFTGLIGVLIKAYVKIGCKIDMMYEFDDHTETLYKKRLDALKLLTNSSMIWNVTQSAKVINQKVAAGANREVSRTRSSFRVDLPFYLNTNCNVVRLKNTKEDILFLPDKILINSKNKLGAIGYDDVDFKVSSVNFIESEPVPKDAKIIDYTWQYVNKNGSPDKRYKNNKKIPKCLYGTLSITSNSGLNMLLYISNHELAESFKQKYTKMTCL